VLRVERGRGDLERFTEYEMFLACNRGKHSMVLDLRSEPDRRMADELVAGARLIDTSRAAGHTQFEYAFQSADGRAICVNAPADDQFAELCAALDESGLARRADMQTFQRRRDVPCAPILAGDEGFDDPQVRYLDVIHGSERPYATLPIAGLPQRVLVDPPPVDGAGPAVGEGGWDALAEPARDRPD
jgi:crotonobetainyl-CoA:carnitine CoA-transferase CaiB-like acyl-CoA transferase